MAKRSRVVGQRRVIDNLIRMAKPTLKDLAASADAALSPIQDEARGQFMRNGSFVTGVIPEQFVIVYAQKRTWALTCTGMAAKLMHMIEFGTEPHLQPNRGIMHPGADPKPAFRPAYEMRRQVAIEAAGEALYRATLARIR
jgi:hypothetical protein